MQSTVLSPLDVTVQHLQHAPGPSAIGANAFALTGKLLNDRTTLRTCAGIIEQDMGLTLRLLRMANSAMFNHSGRTVLSVPHAAALLGTDMLTQLLETVPRTAIPRPARELTLLGQLSGHFAWLLMNRLEPRWSEEAFIAAQFRNVGEIMVALERPDDYFAILANCGGTISGLRAAARKQLQFEFDDLTMALLQVWSFYGTPALAARSTPDALLAQGSHAENSIALAAVVSHYVVTAYFRAEERDRDGLLRAAWPAMARVFRIRESYLAELADAAFHTVEPIAKAMDIAREQLRLKQWISEPAASAPAPPKTRTVVALGGTVDSVLRSALGHGMERVAWLPLLDGGLGVPMLQGNGWPAAAVSEIEVLFPPRKPPFLLAFGQRRDVWIDCSKDDRYNKTELARRLEPRAFFLLPVCMGRTVKGCLYFDWRDGGGRDPEDLLPALTAIRDYMAENVFLA